MAIWGYLSSTPKALTVLLPQWTQWPVEAVQHPWMVATHSLWPLPEVRAGPTPVAQEKEIVYGKFTQVLARFVN